MPPLAPGAPPLVFPPPGPRSGRRDDPVLQVLGPNGFPLRVPLDTVGGHQVPGRVQLHALARARRHRAFSVVPVERSEVTQRSTLGNDNMAAGDWKTEPVFVYPLNPKTVSEGPRPMLLNTGNLARRLPLLTMKPCSDLGSIPPCDPTLQVIPSLLQLPFLSSLPQQPVQNTF